MRFFNYTISSAPRFVLFGGLCLAPLFVCCRARHANSSNLSGNGAFLDGETPVGNVVFMNDAGDVMNRGSAILIDKEKRLLLTVSHLFHKGLDASGRINMPYGWELKVHFQGEAKKNTTYFLVKKIVHQLASGQNPESEAWITYVSEILPFELPDNLSNIALKDLSILQLSEVGDEKLPEPAQISAKSLSGLNEKFTAIGYGLSKDSPQGMRRAEIPVKKIQVLKQNGLAHAYVDDVDNLASGDSGGFVGVRSDSKYIFGGIILTGVYPKDLCFLYREITAEVAQWIGDVRANIDDYEFSTYKPLKSAPSR